MLRKHKILIGVLVALGVVALAVALLSRSSHVSVNLHGVNYSDREFSYFISDPEKPERSIGGEHIAPFAAGGTTCCAVLPSKWKPGTKIRLETIYWMKRQPDGSLPEVETEHVVEVPEYAEPQELWVVRDQTGTISVVASNLQPDHPGWPGAIKGWPVPSVEYQRERWEIYRSVEQAYVSAFESLLRNLEQNPAKAVKEAWEHAQEYRAEEISKFSGPDDPKYSKYLRQNYIDGLATSKNDLAKIMRAKP